MCKEPLSPSRPILTLQSQPRRPQLQSRATAIPLVVGHGVRRARNLRLPPVKAPQNQFVLSLELGTATIVISGPAMACAAAAIATSSAHGPPVKWNTFTPVCTLSRVSIAAEATVSISVRQRSRNRLGDSHKAECIVEWGPDFAEGPLVERDEEGVAARRARATRAWF